MFTSATVKLTLSYLAILMVLCVMFSTALYGFATNELQHGFARQGQRLNNVYPELNFDPALRAEMEYDASSHRILLNLIYLNLFVLLAAGIASYALARWTLQPIENAHEQQKRFTADVSHELRTPLTGLKMTTEVALLDKAASKTELKRALESNLEDVSKIEILINNLLRLSRLEATEVRETFTAVDVRDVIATSIADLSEPASRKKIQVRTDDSGEQLVAGDRASLVQLMTILLDNAIKFSPDKSTVKIATTSDDELVRITLSDRGSGITSADLPHIFDRFYRTDTARKAEQTGGFGLGLSIAKMISELHSGDLELTSKPGVGTTAHLSLPAAKA